jgi:hypothetical protein
LDENNEKGVINEVECIVAVEHEELWRIENVREKKKVITMKRSVRIMINYDYKRLYNFNSLLNEPIVC